MWLALEEKKIPYTYIEVNPYHKPQSLLKLNPRGLVPTLEYHDRPLYESNAICEFLEDAFPRHGRKLRPEDPYDTARMRIWMDFVTSRIIPAFHRLLQFQPGPKGAADEELVALKDDFTKCMKEFIHEMDPEGPFFFGKEPMLVDLVIAPWALRLWVLDEFKGGIGIPAPGQGGRDQVLWSRWRKWSHSMEDRKSVKDTTSERQHYMPIYQRYAEDRAQSELAKATRKGRGVP